MHPLLKEFRHNPLLWLLLFVWKREVEPTLDIVLESHKPGAEVMAYIATYLLPFIGFSISSLRNLTVFAVYLVILGFIPWLLVGVTVMLGLGDTWLDLRRRSKPA